jgi:vancomycin resistance protein VanJ
MEVFVQIASFQRVRTLSWNLMATVIVAVVFLAGGLINIYLALTVTCGACVPIIAMANHVQHFILLADILLVFGALLLIRRRLLIAWLSPGVIGFALTFGPLWIPTPRPDVNDGIQLSAATYNVLGHAADPNTTFAAIKDLDTDFIALQELRPTLRHMLHTQLHEAYPFQFTRIVDYVDGLGLLSKYPFVEEPEHNILLRDRLSARYLRAVVDVDGTHIAVYVYHPPTPRFDFPDVYDDTYLQAQTEFLAGMIEGETLPTLLLCDCNASPHSRQYATLDNILNDAFQARGLGFGLTYPVRFPLIRIDYVWFTDEFVAVDAGVESDVAASDHFPLWATVVLED